MLVQSIVPGKTVLQPFTTSSINSSFIITSNKVLLQTDQDCLVIFYGSLVSPVTVTLNNGFPVFAKIPYLLDVVQFKSVDPQLLADQKQGTVSTYKFYKCGTSLAVMGLTSSGNLWITEN